MVGDKVCNSTLGLINLHLLQVSRKTAQLKFSPQILRPQHSVAFVRMIAHTLTYTLLTFWQ